MTAVAAVQSSSSQVGKRRLRPRAERRRIVVIDPFGQHSATTKEAAAAATTSSHGEDKARDQSQSRELWRRQISVITQNHRGGQRNRFTRHPSARAPHTWLWCLQGSILPLALIALPGCRLASCTKTKTLSSRKVLGTPRLYEGMCKSESPVTTKGANVSLPVSRM